MKTFKLWGAVSLILVLSGVLLSVTAFASDGGDISNPTVMVSEPSTPVLSVAVRDLARTSPDRILNREEINPLRNPGLFKSDLGLTGTFTQKQDPLAANSVSSKLTPATLFDFEGLGTDGYTPPDTVGEVGPNHYVQMVNVSFAIFDKTGTIVVPDTPFTNLFAGSGLTACENENDGDPIVVYDEIADRWLLSQFAVSSGDRMCIAISQTPDPTGTYYLYQFDMPDFPDYFKFGVWPDAYYMSTNTGFPNQYYAYAFDRASMLSGSPATFQYSTGHPNFLLPADLDGGMTSPPPAGSPGYFYTMLSDGYADHPAGVDRLALYEFDVDWATPANSTFVLAQEIPIAAYNYTVCGFFVGDCIPQPGTGQGLDSLSYWPMWRFAYRNLGSYEAMVGNFTVDLDGTDKAAIRWFELQKSGASWSLHQEGTYAPDSDHRWMGSIAMDGSGNIALGYSVSSNTTTPAIRYTVHEVGDPLGTMQAEQQIIQSAGVHTSVSRWGDYSSMNVDPADNCTFWYTNQYDIADNSGFDWHTRVGVFKIPGCTGSMSDMGILTGQVTDASTSNAISAALVSASSITSTFGTTTDALGYYTRTLTAGSYAVTAEAYGFQSSTVSNVEIFSGTTTTQDFALTPAVMYTVDGTVSDVNTGWPLYAHVSISGDPVDPPVTDLWTDPVTGYYQIDLAAGITYTFDVAAWVPGYLPASADVGPLTGDTTADFSLDVDQVACNAPGYALSYAYAENFEANDGGYTHSGTQDEWEWGAPITWPAACSDGISCWGTDLAGNYNNSADNQLLSPVINMPAVTPLTVFWDQAWDIESASFDNAYAEVSINGGVFQQMWSHTGGTTQAPWQGFNYDLSAASGSTVQFRFRFTSDSSVVHNGYYIDNVRVASSCDPSSGGLVVGNVYDENTLAALNGAMVENEDGFMAEAVATPLDGAVDDGFYSIFSPSGSKTFTATISGAYGPDVDLVDVTTGDTIRHDFYLPAPSVSVNPAGLEVTLTQGYSVTVPLDLMNNGAVSTGFELVELGGTVSVFIPASQERTTNNAPRQPFLGVSPAKEFSISMGLPTAENFEVLILTPDANVSDLVAALSAFLDLTVTVYAGDLSTLTATELAGYDVVMTTNNTKWSAIGADVPVGNALADYIDAGGKVIVNAFAYDWAGWQLAGRFITEQYGPFTGTTSDSTGTSTLGTIHDPSHPILNGVTAISNSYLWQNPALAPGATLLVDWNDGNAFLAVNQNVVALNLLPSDGNGVPGWTGDLPTLYHNAIVWLADSVTDIPWLSTDPITGTLATDSMQVIDVTFNTLTNTVGTYTGTLMVKTDDPISDKIEVPVTMHVESVSYGIELAAENDNRRGEPGDVITYTLWMTNTGNVSDGYDISAGFHVWDVDIPTSMPPMAPAESLPLDVAITIPTGAGDGESDSVTVTVSSQGDPAVTAEVILTTEAVIPEYLIYLPLTYK